MLPTSFTNVRVLDCSGASPFDGAVLIAGGCIVRIARAGQTIDAPDALRIDGRGGTLMPGLVEPHAHLSFTHFSQSVQMGDIPPEDHAIMTLHNARIMLDQGFTSCNSAAAAKGRLDIAVRDAINRVIFLGHACSRRAPS
ncbi:MAG: amidohydrolase family protein [Burkholderiales bacterium]